jgi:hypothetical protein
MAILLKGDVHRPGTSDLLVPFSMCLSDALYAVIALNVPLNVGRDFDDFEIRTMAIGFTP